MTDTWTLDELISRFQFHPEFKEIYVEGETDIGLYKWFMEETGRGDVLVYPVNAVSIPEACREQLGLAHLDNESMRSEVILLSVALQRKIPGAADNVTCIADADTQHIKPEDFGSSFLLFTDYTSIELYGFRADLITKLIRIGAPKLKLRGEEVITQITTILEKLFCFRIANYNLGWGLKWISPDKECECEGRRIAFDEALYVKKYLNTNGKRGQEAEFWGAVHALQDSFGENHKLQIRGHDFIELLTWYLRQRSKQAFRGFSSEIVRHNLLSQLRIDDLTQERLFRTLLRKYR